MGVNLKILWLINTLLVLFLITSVLVNSIELWRAWSFLGEEEFYMALSLVFYYLYFDPGRVLLVFLSVVFSGSLNVFFKYWLRLPRPPDPLIPVEGPGFPSGHAQVSTSFWFTLSGVIRERAVYFASSILVTGISLSRLYLRAHYLVDVIGGVVLGLLVCFVVLVLSVFFDLAGRAACVVFSLVFSLISYSALGAPSDTASVLVAASLAVLLFYFVFEVRGIKPGVTSTPLRVFLLVLSLVVVYAAHFATRSGFFTVRVVVLFSAIFSALCFPLVVGVLKTKVR